VPSHAGTPHGDTEETKAATLESNAHEKRGSIPFNRSPSRFGGLVDATFEEVGISFHSP
jgi:hypothetical protein